MQAILKTAAKQTTTLTRGVPPLYLLQTLDRSLISLLSPNHTTEDWVKLFDTEATSPESFVKELQGVVANHKVLNNEFLDSLSEGAYKRQTAEALYDYSLEFRQHANSSSTLVSNLVLKLKEEGLSDESEGLLSFWVEGIEHQARYNKFSNALKEHLDTNRVSAHISKVVLKLKNEGQQDKANALLPFWVKCIENQARYNDFSNEQHSSSSTASIKIKATARKSGRHFAEVVAEMTQDSTAAAVAAIGLATEGIASSTHAFVKTAIKEHSSFPEQESLFLELHKDKHTGVFENITATLATDPGNRAIIVDSIARVVNQRCEVYDALHKRATARAI